MLIKSAPKTTNGQPCIALSGVEDGDVFSLAALSTAINTAANPPEGVSYQNGIVVASVEQPTPAKQQP